MIDLTKAREFAIQAHGDQMYGDKPYVSHLDDVVAVLDTHFKRAIPELLAVGYLHDVLEDTSVTAGTLFEQFGPNVALAVQFCTDEPGPNRKTRKAATYARCRAQIVANDTLIKTQNGYLWPTDLVSALDMLAPLEQPHCPLATAYGTVVKVADRIANLRNCIASGSDLFRMYQKERDAFSQALFVQGLCDDLWYDYAQMLGN